MSGRPSAAAARSVLLAGPIGFNEMMSGSDTRLAYERIARWLADTSKDYFTTRRGHAEMMFRRIGITFNVYGDKDATERLIPFDIIPRVIQRSEWNRLEAGLVQRVKALNAFLADVYGKQEILRAGIVPRELIEQQSGVPPRDGRRQGTARRLRPHRRHRCGAHRFGRLLRPRGQRAHAIRRLLYAGEPRGHDARRAGPLRRAPRGAGRELPPTRCSAPCAR